MRREAGVISAIVFAVLFVLYACKGQPDADGLASELPNLLPQVEDVSVFLPNAQVEVLEVGVRYGKGGYNALHVSDDFDDAVRKTGRVGEFVSRYQLKLPKASPVIVHATVALYDEQGSAQRVLDVLARSPYGSVIPSTQVGDESVAWTSAEAGGDPVCPCQLYFRVGPFLAAVATGSSAGPARAFDGPDLIQVALAQAMVERMRHVLDESSHERQE